MKRLAILALMALSLSACKTTTAANPATLAPGAYNQTDQLLYQSLMAVQASINSLKTQVTANLSLKVPLNQAIQDYDIAEVAYQTYHAALATNPTTSPASVQSAISKVQTDLSSVGTGGAK